ncbi:MAG: hypothetical protein IKJ06_02580 [Clostridia bacterium]|nr:hypothetical protein [Clostridia bacterium]
MKKIFILLCFVFMFLTGCNSPEEIQKGDNTAFVRIVDGAESGNLILAGESTYDVYILSTENIPVFLDGKKNSADCLEDGMPVTIHYSGGIEESFPAKLGSVSCIEAYSRGTEKNPSGTYYDLAGLYLKAMNDIWNEDTALNHDTKYISVNLKDAPGNLTDGEKSAITWIFANSHQKEGLQLSFEELTNKGYIKKDELYWKDGVLFSIADSMNENEIYHGLPVVKFDLTKWRSGLGALFYVDCTASWPQNGTWSDYQVGGVAIS